MFESFEKLPEDKKSKIINICIEEFAEYGYQKASTNRIVEKAEISKGILFHYFGSKKKLFIYLLDYVMEYYEEITKEYIKEELPKDIFERIMYLSMVKLKIVSETSPALLDFMTRAFIDKPKEINIDFMERYKDFSNMVKGFYMQDYDKSKFKEDIDFNKAIEMIFFIREGMSNKYVKIYKGREKDIVKDYDKIMKEFEKYLDILKWGLYKK
ncbi:TetR/AcrR family transcriptional regulator [Sporosalibacterium faouarense]|uniref:TetR/AcrR family transcriptional regulator n=1 Tax=Sporosalibacterium faouarense TaxID=516123 RepID=UPI00192BB04A|nr:TetR/AcrR family transcriptional regulator [Sporosalibacterium faouarense]